MAEPALRRRLRDMLLETTGIKIPDSKTPMMESRLRRRITHCGASGLDDYLAYVFQGGGLSEEWPHVVDAMTTNKTDFFREPAHFDMMAHRVLPEALAGTRPGTHRRFRLWSAAASTGAEAYSLAMLLAEAALAAPQLDWAILGTDISPSVLAKARRAIYPVAELAPVSPPRRARFVMSGTCPDGQASGRIVPELRRRVRFAELNLMEMPYPVDTELDAIFLRNVLIYFTPDTQAAVIAALVPHLRQGGYLFVGHAESMVVDHPELVQLAPAAFVKRRRN
ncbi:protein-glutamate O-methyltransferase CheR [Poseidonocella sp. HB161398]|uniref:CheR family methyltransferase n=1 Tax=Poseidonocella sp. HB161398 TaxID=2320855 RepID=UPI001F1109B5|nr:CheR family methyltransferase [Poseidonocella sp. HB161398]